MSILRTIGLIGIVICTLFVPNSPTPSAASAGSTPTVTGQVLVKFKPGTPAGVVAQVHQEIGGQPLDEVPGLAVQVVAVPTGTESARATAYARNPNVLFAELHGTYGLLGKPIPSKIPNDPLLDQQWHLNNTGQAGGTPGADIGAFAAWKITTGSPTVAIAMLDSGIDQSHEDLSSKIAKNVEFTTSTTVDDRVSHGTWTSGVAGAVTNNRKGVAGVCRDCSLYNVKVVADDFGGDSGWIGTWAGIASGITWAADNGAKVISMSLGGTTPSATVEAAVEYAWGKNVVLVAAAGNNSSTAEMYPAAYVHVIAVAATDRRDVRASFTNYGASWVDVAAPGVEIETTAPDHPTAAATIPVKYAAISGTSLATPQVAGLAGLIWSTTLCTTNSCVRSRIEQGADAIPGTGTDWAAGRINAARSLAP